MRTSKQTEANHGLGEALSVSSSFAPDTRADTRQTPPLAPGRKVDGRLRRHADYQRVYKEGRKQHSTNMAFFYAVRGHGQIAPESPRVGLTAGRVLGKAVDRNRIKRRLRELVRRNLGNLPPQMDVVLHPRRSVLKANFAGLAAELEQVFARVNRGAADKPGKRREDAGRDARR